LNGILVSADKSEDAGGAGRWSSYHPDEYHFAGPFAIHGSWSEGNQHIWHYSGAFF
jgi:hypothetical protein